MPQPVEPAKNSLPPIRRGHPGRLPVTILVVVGLLAFFLANRHPNPGAPNPPEPPPDNPGPSADAASGRSEDRPADPTPSSLDAATSTAEGAEETEPPEEEPGEDPRLPPLSVEVAVGETLVLGLGERGFSDDFDERVVQTTWIDDGESLEIVGIAPGVTSAMSGSQEISVRVKPDFSEEEDLEEVAEAIRATPTPDGYGLVELTVGDVYAVSSDDINNVYLDNPEVMAIKVDYDEAGNATDLLLEAARHGVTGFKLEGTELFFKVYPSP